jgi:hypothetical protein
MERVLFIGTRFSNLYTDTPASQPEPFDMHDVCVLVCKCVYLCSKVPGPCIPRTRLPIHFLAFDRSSGVLTWPHAVKTPVRYHTSSYRPFRSSASLHALIATQWVHIAPRLPSPLDRCPRVWAPLRPLPFLTILTIRTGTPAHLASPSHRRFHLLHLDLHYI